jgi:peptide/nickel transport system substrate-binding protein
VSDYHFIIMPVVDGKMDWAGGKGTGPYVLEQYDPGVKATFTRNPNYWKEGRAHFDAVETLSIIDNTARQTAIQTGAVDLIDKVDPKTVHLMARVANINILETTGTQHYTYPMRCNVDPFSNVDFRLAVKHMVDREELLKKVLVGHGAVGNDYPISTANRYHATTDEIPQRVQDLDKAKHHLKKSGFDGKVQLSAAEAAFGGAVDGAVLIAEAAKKIGLDIEIIREPNDGYWANVWNKKPWCACYWGGRPTEDWMFSAAYSRDAKWNDTAWLTNDRFNDLLVQARAELDEPKRRAMYVEMQQIVRDDGGVLLPMWANHIHALANNLMHDEKVAGNWQNDGNKNTERWWFA